MQKKKNIKLLYQIRISRNVKPVLSNYDKGKLDKFSKTFLTSHFKNKFKKYSAQIHLSHG